MSRIQIPIEVKLTADINIKYQALAIAPLFQFPMQPQNSIGRNTIKFA